MNKPLISIIIPVYNCEKYIGRCLDSIVKQTYDNMEVIVINDGSTDSTQKICEEYDAKYEFLHLYNQENHGVSYSRNFAIKIAKGEYVQFTDSDDYLNKCMIEKMVNSAIDNDSDIVFCEYEYEYEEKQNKKVITLKDYHEKSLKDLISDESSKYGGFPWNKLIKKSCINKLYNEDLKYYENLLFFLENIENIKKYSVVHEPLYTYYINCSSALHCKEYSTKRVTALDALDIVITIVSDKYKDFYKYHYISQTLWNIKNIKKNKIEFDYSKYEVKASKYKKELLKKNNLNLKMKIKLIIKIIRGK